MARLRVPFNTCVMCVVIMCVAFVIAVVVIISFVFLHIAHNSMSALEKLHLFIALAGGANVGLALINGNIKCRIRN